MRSVVRSLKACAVAALALTCAAAPARAQLTVQFWGPVADGGGPAPSFNGPLSNVFCTAQMATINFANASALGSFIAGNCPGAPAVTTTGFSVGARVTGFLWADAAGTRTFGGRIDDGNRWYINGVLHRDAWFDQLNDFSFTAPVNAGWNSIQVDYYANTYGHSVFQLSLPSGTQFAFVPEPAALALTATGLALMTLALRRRRA
ncbi:MAG: PEP-CTERM sorting domain-containing protein [Gemmatimonadaceae bacterium]|jgi:hypothetical protein|nr:PEP-CTERM sorting domain-containing protein [Gemmatimonadaceae bacterium]